jgi:hypothetical protein
MFRLVNKDIAGSGKQRMAKYRNGVQRTARVTWRRKNASESTGKHRSAKDRSAMHGKGNVAQGKCNGAQGMARDCSGQQSNARDGFF